MFIYVEDCKQMEHQKQLAFLRIERGSIDLVIVLFRQKYRWYYWGTMKLIGYYWGVLAFTFDNRQSPFGPFPRLQLYLTYFFREIKLYKKKVNVKSKTGKNLIIYVIGQCQLNTDNCGKCGQLRT